MSTEDHAPCDENPWRKRNLEQVAVARQILRELRRDDTQETVTPSA